MNGLALTLALLTAAEPDCCHFRPPPFDRFAHLPPLSDRNRFERDSYPTCWTARDQFERCGAWSDYLHELRMLHGYGDGHWDRQMEALTEARRFWNTLAQAHEDNGEEWKREWLARLRDLIGPDAYVRGWRPGLLPPAPVLPAVAPTLPVGGAN